MCSQLSLSSDLSHATIWSQAQTADVFPTPVEHLFPFPFASIMRLSALLLAVGCAAPLGASAQYFSQGWKPGQAAPAPSSTPHAFDPSTAPAAAAPAQKAKTDYGLSSILTNFVSSGPIASLLNRAGINVTERLSAAQQDIWDERIPLITDENYKEVIVNEVFETEQEEKDRVWFLIMCALSPCLPLARALMS